MASNLSTISVGEHAGELSIKIDLALDPLTSTQDLASRIALARRPGVRFVELVGDDIDATLNDSLRAVGFDRRLQGLQIWTRANAAKATNWSVEDVWWCLDLSALFAEGMHSKGLLEGIERLPELPQPSEIVIDNPSYLTAHALDELALALQAPGCSWIHARREAMPKIIEEVSKCVTWWGVRPIGEDR